MGNLVVTVARAAAAAAVVVSSLAMMSKQKCKTWCSGTEDSICSDNALWGSTRFCARPSTLFGIVSVSNLKLIAS